MAARLLGRPPKRDDISRFLVHLTRDYDDSKARENLLGILSDKKIEARNAHCLVMHKLATAGLSSVLRKKFRSVCFTEAPLSQIDKLTSPLPKRQIRLKPYGLVFWKEELMDSGASPALYVNARGSDLSQYLLAQFEDTFRGTTQLRSLRAKQKEHCESIIQFFALLNVVSKKHDFLWEREWRHMGDFPFQYRDIVAVIARKPDEFREEYAKLLRPSAAKLLNRIPHLDPNWNHEEIVEALAIQMWDGD